MPDIASGVLKRKGKGPGLLREPARSFRRGPNDVSVPLELIEKYGLPVGASVTGPVRETPKGLELVHVESVCGLPPEQFQARNPFSELVAIHPEERYHLAVTGDVTMRVVDLMAPIGKGTRGLIVSPPKAGKTIILQKIANAIHADSPDTRIIVLLIDERPEEVTDFRRAVKAEVLASSNDQSVEDHVSLAELTLAHIRIELECGHDIVILLDSITRMGRSFNVTASGRGRVMSGGVEAGALEIPRKFFGLARNIENGGSVTIIATALIDTGSRMDQLIFEEFKGTGNSEIVLDRSLAEARLYPAIDLNASGTRREERLHTPRDGERIALLRRALAEMPPKDAMAAFLERLRKFKTNEELLANVAVR